MGKYRILQHGTLMQKLTSFTALNDPELLAATVLAVGADALMPLLEGTKPFSEERTHHELHDPYLQPLKQL